MDDLFEAFFELVAVCFTSHVFWYIVTFVVGIVLGVYIGG
jgi:uncharacterized membrane protein